MQDTPPGRYTAIAMVLGSMGLIPAAAYIPAPVSSADFAAWAQGIGTVAAVGVAAWVGLLPTLRERSERDRSRDEFIKALQMAFAWADTSLSELKEVTEGRDLNEIGGISYAVNTMEPAEPLLRLLQQPMTSWPSTPLYLEAFTVAGAIKDVVEYGLNAARRFEVIAEAPIKGEVTEERAKLIASARAAHDEVIWSNLERRFDTLDIASAAFLRDLVSSKTK